MLLSEGPLGCLQEGLHSITAATKGGSIYMKGMHDSHSWRRLQPVQVWALRQMPRYRLRQQWFSKTLMLPQSRHLFVIIAPSYRKLMVMSCQQGSTQGDA